MLPNCDRMFVLMPKKNKVLKSKWLDLLIFVLFLNVFFFHSFGTVALALLLTEGYVLVRRVFGKFGLGSSALFGISILTMFLVNSPEKIVLLTLLVIAIFLVTAYLGLKRERIGGILELALSSLLIVREYIRSGLLIVASAMRGTLRKVLQLDTIPKERSPWIKSIVAGLVVGLPLTAWLVSTLSNADPVFAAFIQDLLSEKFLSELPGRMIMSGIALLLLMPILLMQWRGYRSPLAWMSRVYFGREMSIVLLMVVVILGLFLAVQWPYVFARVARETDLSQYGVATYSEYVTRGFWDLLKVAVMVFGVSWITLLIAKNQRGREYRILWVMQGILGLEFVVFIVSIFRRVWLYQNYHGLTLARLYGLVLLIFVVGMMVTMGLRYAYQNVRWVRVEVAWMMIVIFGAIAINMESLIVKDPPTVNDRVDYVYLSRLSSDGKVGWLQAYNWAKDTLNNQYYAENLNGHMKFFTRDERRDIYYAGLITRELTRNYHSLILQYGSDEEVREYFKQVIYTTEQIAVEKPMSDKQWLNDLDKADWIDKVDITPTARVVPQWDYGFPNYKAHQDDPYFYIQGWQEVERLTGLDYVLAYSSSCNQGYDWIKQEVGYEQLLKMQELDFGLQKRISLQPENERDFDIDVSLDSPFLR